MHLTLDTCDHMKICSSFLPQCCLNLPLTNSLRPKPKRNKWSMSLRKRSVRQTGRRRQSSKWKAVHEQRKCDEEAATEEKWELEVAKAQVAKYEVQAKARVWVGELIGGSDASLETKVSDNGVFCDLA